MKYIPMYYICFVLNINYETLRVHVGRLMLRDDAFPWGVGIHLPLFGPTC